jgi:hypothetical protein
VEGEKNKININTFFDNIKNVLFDLNEKKNQKKIERYKSNKETELVLLDFLNYSNLDEKTKSYSNLDEKKSYIDLKYKSISYGWCRWSSYQSLHLELCHLLPLL